MLSMKMIALRSDAYKEKGETEKNKTAGRKVSGKTLFQEALLACLTERAFIKWLMCAMLEQMSECGFCHSFQPAVS